MYAIRPQVVVVNNGPRKGLGGTSPGFREVSTATPDKMRRAYDTRDGEVLWEAALTAAGFSTPAVYSGAGTQFVVIAAGGGRTGPPSGAEYVAFSLSDAP